MVHKRGQFTLRSVFIATALIAGAIGVFRYMGGIGLASVCAIVSCSWLIRIMAAGGGKISATILQGGLGVAMSTAVLWWWAFTPTWGFFWLVSAIAQLDAGLTASLAAAMLIPACLFASVLAAHWGAAHCLVTGRSWLKPMALPVILSISLAPAMHTLSAISSLADPYFWPEYGDVVGMLFLWGHIVSFGAQSIWGAYCLLEVMRGRVNRSFVGIAVLYVFTTFGALTWIDPMSDFL